MNCSKKTANDIHLKTTSVTEKDAYTLTNPYTTADEKIEIESWYQLPFDIGGSAYLIGCILWAYGVIGWWQAYVFAAGAVILTSLFKWFLYSKKTLFSLKVIFGNPVVKLYFSIFCVVWLWMNGFSIQALCIIGNLALWSLPVGFSTLITRRILTGKYRMHPKYAFLKHIYGRVFAFESHNR